MSRNLLGRRDLVKRAHNFDLALNVLEETIVIVVAVKSRVGLHMRCKRGRDGAVQGETRLGRRANEI